MDWNPDSHVKLIVGNDNSSEDADLILVGVFAPPKEEGADEEEGEEEKELGPLILEGKAMELDERLGGLLKELAVENGKEFKNGGEAGCVTTAGRVVDGGKVSLIGYLCLG
jgi:hypothetical protein